MLNTNIYLISEQYVKQNSALMQNVEKQFIEQHIIESQNLDMYEFLGKDLYDRVMSEWENFWLGSPGSPGTVVDPDIKTLTYDYIRPMLLYFTLYYSMYDFHMKHTNKGTNVQNSQNSVPADIMMLEKQRKDYRNKGEVYATRMLEYLNANVDLFPEFQNIADCETGAPSAYSNPWYLDDA